MEVAGPGSGTVLSISPPAEQSAVPPKSALAEPHSELAPLVAQARTYIAAAKADNTRRAYRSDWKHFAAWCENNSLPPLPASPDSIALYLTSLARAGNRPSTIQRRLTSISQAHRAAGHTSPASLSLAPVSETMKGIRRLHGTAPHTKRPLLTADLRRLIEHLPNSLQGTRDKAILLLGFAAGFRRSELSALDIEHLSYTSDGLTVTLARSKTDQEGQGRVVGIPYGRRLCPAQAVRDWTTAASLSKGALFRGINRHEQVRAGRIHSDSIGRIIQRAVERIGLDPTEYAGHSLRSGLVTQAYLGGVREHTIMQQTGHRTTKMLRRYIRNVDIYLDNAASALGL